MRPTASFKCQRAAVRAVLRQLCSHRICHGAARRAFAVHTQQGPASWPLGTNSGPYACSLQQPYNLPRAACCGTHWAAWQLAASCRMQAKWQMALRAAAGPSSSSSTCVHDAEEGRLLDAFVGPDLRLMEQHYAVNGRVFTLHCPADADAVLDMYINAGIDGDPFWTRVWVSAIALAQLLLQRPELVRGKRVADVGCGLGVAGVAAAMAGASEVVLLDREPLALQCALRSALASGMTNVQPPDSVAASDSSNHNDSSSSNLAAAVDGSNSQVPGLAVLKARQFDWNTCDPAAAAGGRFDVILACDVLYEAEAVAPLSGVIPQLLKSTSGLLLLADPSNRTASTVNREQFLERLSEAGSGRVGSGAFALEECWTHPCEVVQLDADKRAGEQSKSETVPVQMLVIRRTAGSNTVGLKSWAAATA